ncbi:MAG: alkaline phosphatase [Armatimonadota bacterium]|nr:MAG: alkaline phosphatase [Armatimonadota bacterium]
MTSSDLSRRELLQAGAAALVSSGLLFREASAQGRTRSTPVKNIIFMVSDGMSMGVPSIAEPFSQMVRGRGTHWFRLLQDPEAVVGLFETRSLDSLVTDSSAASSAWGSGSRVFNGAVNVLPDGTKLTPIAHVMRRAGKKLGLVTTTTITHATPAGFAASHWSRDEEQVIAEQYLEVVDVLMGGGRRFFDPEQRSDKRNLIEEYQRKGYAFWERREQVRGRERPEKVLGLFYGGHVPYTIDHQNDPQIWERVPTLAEMTRAALEILSRSPKGFLLQVEGGRVDHAAHANDAAALLWDQLAFDDAIPVAVDFVRRHPDTLLVITSDHGNSNPGLNGMGEEYRDSAKCLERITQAKGSYVAVQELLKKAGTPTADRVREAVREITGVEITREEAEVVASVASGKTAPTLNRAHANLSGVLGEILSNYNGIAWIGTQHTGDWTLVTALGAGKEMFAGIQPHKEAFHRMLRLSGISFRNPEMTPEQAKRYLARAPRIRQVHWV